MTTATNQPTVVLKDEGLRRLEGFTQIPNVVLTHPGISANAKITYGVLLSYAWQKDFCWPAQERIAQDTNCSVRTVQRYLAELEKGGLIAIRQRGLNRPNIYEILPISGWHNGPKSLKNKDTTELTPPDTTGLSPQDATDLSYKEDSGKKIQKVVNDVTDHDQKISTGPKRKPPARSGGTISDAALRSKYGLDDSQIGTVHRLVEKQGEILGSLDRNFAAYVDRAARAAQNRDHELLDAKLGEMRDVLRDTPIGSKIGSRPAYFHAMYTEALAQRSAPVRLVIRTDSRGTDPQPIGQTVSALLSRAVEAKEEEPDRVRRLIHDAERRGHQVPPYIRESNNFAQVSRWWAARVDPDRKES
jgi:hypothetical protein